MYDEAELLQIKVIDIAKKTLGPEHPDLAQYLHDRAVLLDVQVRATGKLREFSRGLRLSVSSVTPWCTAPTLAPLLDTYFVPGRAKWMSRSHFTSGR